MTAASNPAAELTEAECDAEALTVAILHHYGYTDAEIEAAENVHPGHACDNDECFDEDGKSIHGDAHTELHATASIVVEVVLPWVAARLADDGAATDDRLLHRFADWVASNRAFNGSDYPHGQSLYNECLNAVLHDWATDFVADAAPAPTEDATTERRLVRRGKCTCGEVTPENHWGHADGCRYFADSVYEDVPVSRAADTASEEPRTEALPCHAELCWHTYPPRNENGTCPSCGKYRQPDRADRLSRADEEAGS